MTDCDEESHLSKTFRNLHSRNLQGVHHHYPTEQSPMLLRDRSILGAADYASSGVKRVQRGPVINLATGVQADIAE